MELYWRDTLQWASEADYLQMIGNKTGGLFRLILRLLENVNKFEYEIEPVVDIIGLMFQILDDYKNLKDDKVLFFRIFQSFVILLGVKFDIQG